MPSPFPGMDPFLEHPGLFPNLHGNMTTYLMEAIQVKLPEPYFAVVSERLWVETTGDDRPRRVEPDVDVLHPGDRAERGEEGESAVATATRTRPIVIPIRHDPRRETFVEVRTRASDGGERLVTTIELLSPSNKTPGEHSRELYVQKQREMMESQSHLVEIDLLRGGQHTTAAPRDRIESKAGRFAYHVCLHLFTAPLKCFVYPWRLEERLPEIAIPLLPGDDPVTVDLQPVFDRCYDAGPYRRRVRYELRNIEPPLTDEQARWAEKILKETKV